MPTVTPLGQAHVFRLAPGTDLLDEIHAYLNARSIRFGMISVIGAVEKAVAGAYRFDEKRYVTFEIPHEAEILHCTGNVSMLEGKPFAHLHAVFSDERGSTQGGHVFQGCTVKVAECCLLEFTGEPLVRGLDPETGLKLWPSGT